MTASAKILKYKVKNSMKKMLLIGNGSPRQLIAIQLYKRFDLEDAQKIMSQVNDGRF